MSGEGKYGRLPKPKDRSKGVSVTMGDVALAPAHDKAAEYEEETGDPYSAPSHAKAAPEESMVAKLGRLAGSLGAASSRPWSKMMGNDEEEPK